MLVNRTTLFTFAAVATLAIAGTTAAAAGSLCKSGFGGFAKAYNPAPQQRSVGKAAYVQPKANAGYSKPASRPYPAAEPVKPTTVVGAAKPATSADVTDTSSVSAAKPASVVSPAKPTAVAKGPANATQTCFTKEYLNTGAVRFKDTCTKEWAINSTNVDTKASKIGNGCLTKENSQNGVVMFKDICTGEWAMNTVEELALAEVR